MNIELPKDAEGREIPLDTVCMYDCGGDPVSVTRWCFTTRLDPTFSEKNIWIAVDKERLVKDPALLYLTPPDSWEKLLEDLDNAASKTYCGTCSYFGVAPVDCDMCTICDVTSCDSAAMFDIASRIRKLRGSDE